MPLPLRSSWFGTFALAGLVATALAVAAGALEGEPATPESEAGAWAGLVGGDPAAVDLGQRVIVVLKAPSLAERVRRAGGRASDREHRRWRRAAASAQSAFVSRMTIEGARFQPELRFTRVFNGFSTTLDPRSHAVLERSDEVVGVYPVRAAFPAAVSARPLTAQSALSAPVGMPGFDGRGVTVALLDTGLDRSHPALAHRLLPGIDVVGEGASAEAAAHPDDPVELERHGTELAGIVAGAPGEGGVRGVAPAASLLPIRIAGWQRDATGRWAVYARTDQLVAGLERAVDPNGDGDAHDAARIALVGVAERFAAFAGGPLARAAAGALILDTLVVAPAGNDGPKGPGYGSISGPGGAPAALTVAAADLRPRQQRARLVVRVGLNLLVDRVAPLAGLAAPIRPVNLQVARPRLFESGASAGEQAAGLELEDFFDEGGFSLVAGRVALVPGGREAKRVVAAAARAGAAAVVLYGSRIPAGGLGVDERSAVPVAMISEEEAGETIAALERGASVGISIGSVETAANPSARDVASFSSRGLAFDGGVKPELVAPGVALPTSEPGALHDGSPRSSTVSGSSAAAAVAAGAAALVAQARPGLDAATLGSILVGSARPLAGASVIAQGAGLVDPGAAVAAELAATPVTLGFGRASEAAWQRTLSVEVRNVSTRTLRLRLSVERDDFPAAETRFTVTPARLRLRPGRSATVRLRAAVARPAEGGPAAQGVLVAQPTTGGALRIPFAVAFGPERAPLLGAVQLSERAFAPSETKPAILGVRAGAVRTIGGVDEIEPLSRLDVEVWTAEGERLGVIARIRNVLPGRFTFGITGHAPDGEPLPAGPYRLRLVAYPTGPGRAVAKTLQFSVK